MLNKEFKIFCLRQDYEKLYDLTYKLQNHIYKMYELYIIDTTEKNLFINELYEMTNSINMTYNSTIFEYNNNSDIETNSLIIHYANDFGVLYNLINDNYIKNGISHEINVKIIQPIKEQIKEYMYVLMTKIGFVNLHDFIIFNNSTQKIRNYYDNFLPIKIQITSKKYNKFTIVKNNDPPSNIFLSFYDIFLNCKNKTYHIQGVFTNDYLNLDTRVMSQIIYPELFNKKCEILELVKNNDFMIKYMKYCDKGELLSMSTSEILQMLKTYEKIYNKNKNKSFSFLMQHIITKVNKPIEIFNIIKVLLLGSSDQINIAGMLFLVLKEKKTNNIMLSNIIYASLNFVSQVKLKMVNININTETERLSKITYDEVDLRKQLVLVKNIPLYVKNAINEKINEMKLNNNDYYKQYTYAKSLIEFPWPDENEKKFMVSAENSNDCKTYLKDIKTKLDQITFGHIKAKERIILHLGELISNPDSNGCILSFLGSPGVGKTMLAQSLSIALDIPLITISLGGQNDGEILHGTAYTYASAQPGTIIREIIKMGTTRCILYLDELDKSSSRGDKNNNNDINSIISQLTDNNMNSMFTDRFFNGIHFPLKNLIIIASYNTNEYFEDSLLNRFDEITIKPYNISEKIHISKIYILNEICKKMNFEYKIIINDENLKYIINTYTRESGLREMKRKLKVIVLKLNKLKLFDVLKDEIDIDIDDKSITLDIDMIKNFLKDEEIYEYNNLNYVSGEIGVINGLYASNSGFGGIITIQIGRNFHFNDTFSFTYTGSQSDDMKESVQCAYNSAINYIMTTDEYNEYSKLKTHITDNFSSGFHVHISDICTPKGGGSGGCAFALAFISIILNKPINNKIAVTGELDIKDNVKKVGNILIKVINAKNNGISTVLIPQENYSDIILIKKEYPEIFDSKFNYHLISNLSEAVNMSF